MTTLSGAAGTLGKLDGQLSRDEVLAHCTQLSAVVSIPVAADYENGFADDPADVAESVRSAAETGLAGVSIEVWSGSEIYDRGLAVERVAATELRDAGTYGYWDAITPARNAIRSALS